MYLCPRSEVCGETSEARVVVEEDRSVGGAGGCEVFEGPPVMQGLFCELSAPEYLKEEGSLRLMSEII